MKINLADHGSRKYLFNPVSAMAGVHQKINRRK